MVLTYFLLCLAPCQSTILRSKDLQMDISTQFPTARDLLKTQLVDRNWISVDKNFNRITPTGGIFENRETKEIIFETRENSWKQTEIDEKLRSCCGGLNIFEKYMERKNWNKIFSAMIYIVKFKEQVFLRGNDLWDDAEDFEKAGCKSEFQR